MWISKKRWNSLIKKIADLEKQIQSLQGKVSVSENLYESAKRVFREVFHQKETVAGNVDIRIIRVDTRSILQIGNEQVEVVDYNIKSSADSSTELSVVIKGNATTLDSSASLEVLTRWCQ